MHLGTSEFVHRPLPQQSANKQCSPFPKHYLIFYVTAGYFAGGYLTFSQSYPTAQTLSQHDCVSAGPQ